MRAPQQLSPAPEQRPSLGHRPVLPHLIAGWAEGARGVAVALLAASAAGESPCVRGTVVTGLPHHVWEAPALPLGRLTPAALRALAVLPDSAQVVADALCEEKNMAPPCQPALPLPDCPDFTSSLFSESAEVWAHASGQAWLTQRGMTPSTAQEPSSCPRLATSTVSAPAHTKPQESLIQAA